MAILSMPKYKNAGIFSVSTHMLIAFLQGLCSFYEFDDVIQVITYYNRNDKCLLFTSAVRIGSYNYR